MVSVIKETQNPMQTFSVQDIISQNTIKHLETNKKTVETKLIAIKARTTELELVSKVKTS